MRMLHSMPGIAISTMLALVAATGGAYAAGKVTSAQIKDETVLSRDIRNGQIKLADLATSSVTATKIASGAVGANALANNSVTGEKIVDASITPADMGAVPFAQLSMSGTSLIPNDDTMHALAWDAEGSDTGNMHAPGDTKIIAPRSGIYHVDAMVYWSNSSVTGWRIANVQYGTDAVSQFSMGIVSNANGPQMSQNFSSDLLLHEGDWVKVLARQNSAGATLNTRFSGMNIRWVAPLPG